MLNSKLNSVPIAIITSHGARTEVLLESYPEYQIKFFEKNYKDFYYSIYKKINQDKKVKIIPGGNDILSQFLNIWLPYKDNINIHSTLGTSNSIFYFLNNHIFTKSNHEFENNFLEKSYVYSSGVYGGIVQLASLCVERKLNAVFFFLDPRDYVSDSPENRALQRICINKQIPLLTSLRAAQEWLRDELNEKGNVNNSTKNNDKTKIKYQDEMFEISEPKISFGGIQSVPEIDSGPQSQTVALISHDNLKEELIKFVEINSELLSSFYRILATGTSGWLIKTLFATEELRSKYLKEAKQKIGDDRFKKLLDTSLTIQKNNWLSGFPKPCPELTEKLFPMESGPEGGDVMIALEVLKRACDYIVFFQDTMNSHPHEADIRLLQKTCQLPGTFSVCISDKESATSWAKAKFNNWRI